MTLGRVLENDGTVNLRSANNDSSSLYFSNGTVNNNGTWIAAASNATYGTYAYGAAAGQSNVFNNNAAGTFAKQGQGLVAFDSSNGGVAFNNAGTVNAQQGTLQLNSSFSQRGGTFNLGGAAVSSTKTLNILGGSLSGSGTITGSLANAGTIAVAGDGSAGAITITGNLTQTSTGTLNVDLGGTSAGTQYDQLVVTGSATLDGAVNVSLINGYAPPPGHQLPVSDPRVARRQFRDGPRRQHRRHDRIHGSVQRRQRDADGGDRRAVGAAAGGGDRGGRRIGLVDGNGRDRDDDTLRR
jgi:hypothetical protein